MKPALLLYPAFAAIYLAFTPGLITCAQPSRSPAQPPDSLEWKMKAIFKPYDRHDGPGCAVAVISSGRVIFTNGYGMANLEYDIPITPTTIFDIASVSKQFTGWAISTLIQEGKISPDDEVHKYLPDLPSFGTPVTIRHLLHHISGIRDWPQTLNAAGWRWDEVFSFADIMRMVKYQKDLDFPPGTRYSYSNTGYNLLAAIVQRVSGRSFRDWTDERIFGPLGMPSSHFLDDPNRVIRNLAYSYSPGDAGDAVTTSNPSAASNASTATGATFRKDPDALTAYGSSSLFTSVDDLCKWVIHFDEAVHTNDPVVTRMLDDGILNDGSKVHYGYGLGLGEDRGLKNISHTGGWAGYRTIISNYPDQDLSIIILSNASDFDPNGYAARVADLFLAGKFPSTTPKTTENLQALPTITVSPQLLAKCAGTYQLGPGWAVTLTVENNGLMTQANGEDKFPMEAKSDSVFWIGAYGSSMTFKMGPDGKVDSLLYKSIHAKKIIPWRPRPAQLTDYSGIYYSEELATEYTIDTAGGHGQLMMHQRRLGDIPLTPDPTADDQFDNPIGIFLFVRDGQHGVTGFRLSGGRVKNLRFDKITRHPVE